MKTKISSLSSILMFIAAIALIISLFVPLWSIYLDAPQYPEGLSLQIWANNIAGDVDIINGLNHYIGMKTLHKDDFIEFTILPYIISAFAIFFAFVAIIKRKPLLYTALISFVIFGIVSMIDFWKWEYDYGHNLDPNAAIKVPGMAYQPPLIGFKQLLNFGAFSIPDVGGWLFILAGILVLVAAAFEFGLFKKFQKNKSNIAATALFLSLFVMSCGNKGPVAIQLNKDACESCKMTISDAHFGTEIITKKGRVYKFDDFSCLKNYLSENGTDNIELFYIHDYNKENSLIDATQAWYVKGESLKSPMGGNIAAFSNKEEAQKVASENNSHTEDWSSISK